MSFRFPHWFVCVKAMGGKRWEVLEHWNDDHSERHDSNAVFGFGAFLKNNPIVGERVALVKVDKEDNFRQVIQLLVSYDGQFRQPCYDSSAIEGGLTLAIGRCIFKAQQDELGAAP